MRPIIAALFALLLAVPAFGQVSAGAPLTPGVSGGGGTTDASDLTEGQLPVGRLVDFLAAANVFTNTQTIPILRLSRGGGNQSSFEIYNATADAINAQILGGAGDQTTSNAKFGIFKMWDTNASHTVNLVAGSNVTADRTVTVTTGDADRPLDFTFSGTCADGTSLTVVNGLVTGCS